MRDDEPPIEAVHAQAMGQRLHYHMSGYTNKEIAERRRHREVPARRNILKRPRSRGFWFSVLARALYLQRA